MLAEDADMEQQTSLSSRSDATARAKGGRPRGFPIDGVILRERREARGLEPDAAHKQAFPTKTIEDESRSRTWRRWEATGRIEDRCTAESVARSLGTTIVVLQGGPAPDRVAEITEQLEIQAQAGNARAQEALAAVAAENGGARTAAKRVATRIELAQLTRQAERLSELAELTGWNLQDLEQPANIHGYWLLASESALGPSNTQVVIGVDAALWQVHREVLSWLRPGGDEYPTAISADARLIFREDAPWFRVHFEHPIWPSLNRTLSLVRCEPGEAGLKWTGPARYDRRQIERLPFQFWEHANFVDGLAAGDCLQDLRRLRLIVERMHPGRVKEALMSGELAPPPEIAAVVEGDLKELEDERLAQFRASGEAHSIVVNWVSQGLWPALKSGLEQWPRECWKLSAGEGSILIELDTRPYIALQLGRQPRCETRYRIRLVALHEDGSLRPQPWRRDGVSATMKLLDQEMRDLPTPPPPGQLFVGPPRPAGWSDADD